MEPCGVGSWGSSRTSSRTLVSKVSSRLSESLLGPDRQSRGLRIRSGSGGTLPLLTVPPRRPLVQSLFTRLPTKKGAKEEGVEEGDVRSFHRPSTRVRPGRAVGGGISLPPPRPLLGQSPTDS